MKSSKQLLPYEAPWIRDIGFTARMIVCTSPNRPGNDLPWYPEDDDEL